MASWSGPTYDVILNIAAMNSWMVDVEIMSCWVVGMGDMIAFPIKQFAGAMTDSDGISIYLEKNTLFVSYMSPLYPVIYQYFQSKDSFDANDTPLLYHIVDGKIDSVEQYLEGSVSER